jgi:nucleoside-diphosphate-sugar epimerase
MSEQIFLAGAAGAIGTALAPLLIEAGYTVYGSIRRAERARGLEARGAVGGAKHRLGLCTGAPAPPRGTSARPRSRRHPPRQAAGWALVPHGNRQEAAQWFADVCSTAARHAGKLDGSIRQHFLRSPRLTGTVAEPLAPDRTRL